ncbi:myosin-2 heavy chain, non muscle-like [Momordica charantia]|uniref:Myosin-2 heavy chain, non muscle-like n=1 Tax=Momordica charantia TaxID=3673 RepID=A0A6J1DBU6_MOMCH|nr:myosin-2 heavy chain, non muscle-like [Momordica charantia]
MAKKKATRVAKEPKQMQNQPQQEDSDPEQSRAAMDDSVLKLQSLKSLNDRLVKETHERRMEVGALVKTKDALEIDLKRNVDEKNQVMGELGEACEGIYGLDLEKNVVSVFLQSQMEEMGGGICGLMAEKRESERLKEMEIGLLKAEVNELVLKVEEEREKWRRVRSERDAMKIAFDGLLEETGDLRGKMERNERMALEEIAGLKGKCEKLMGEKMEIEVVNGTLLKENESVKKLLDESAVVIEDLERKMEEKMKEKVEIEREKDGLQMEILKLEKEVVQLNESTFSFKQEKKENEQRISEIEKRTEEAIEKENGMLMEIDALVKQLQKKEKDMEMLTQQRESLELNLNLVQEEVGNLRRTIEVITRDKVEMEEKKKEAENIIGELQRESSKLKEAITSLTELGDVEKARNEELLSEISRLRDALVEVSFERDDARKSFSDEKGSVEKLSLLLKDKESRLVEAMISQEDSLNIKKEMEKRIDILVGERDSMEKNLLEAQRRIDDLKAEVKSAVANSEKALALLKKTCLAVCDGYEKGVGEASSEPFVEHLNAIRTSFTNKEKMVEEMKHRLETARVEERKKSFFTIMTAATTILAAVSAVYVSRGR